MVTSIKKLEPLDLGLITNNDLRALVLLANSLGWDVELRQGQPARLRVKVGDSLGVLELVTTGQVASGYWTGSLKRLAKVSRTLGVEPHSDLIEAVCKATKLDASHRTAIYKAFDVEKPDHKPKPPEPTPITAWRSDGPPHQTSTNEQFALVDAIPRKAVKAESYKTYHPDGRLRYTNDRVRVVTYDDGTSELRCTDCDEVIPTPAHIGSHGRYKHPDREPSPESKRVTDYRERRQQRLDRVKDYQKAAAVERQRELQAQGIGAPKAETQEPANPALGRSAPLDLAELGEALWDANAILMKIRLLIAPTWDYEMAKLRATNSDLEAKVRELEAEVERLTGQWNALKDLIQ